MWCDSWLHNYLICLFPPPNLTESNTSTEMRKSNNTVKQSQAECKNFKGEKNKQNACSCSYSLIGSICLEQAYRLLPWRPRTQMNISYANSVGPQLQPVSLFQENLETHRDHGEKQPVSGELVSAIPFCMRCSETWLFWEVKITSETHSWSYNTFFFFFSWTIKS